MQETSSSAHPPVEKTQGGKPSMAGNAQRWGVEPYGEEPGREGLSGRY